MTAYGVEEVEEEETPTGCFDRTELNERLSEADSELDADLLFMEDEVSQSRISVRPRGPACLTSSGTSGLDASSLFDDVVPSAPELPRLEEPRVSHVEPIAPPLPAPVASPPAPVPVAAVPTLVEQEQPEQELRRMRKFVVLLSLTVLATAAYIVFGA